MDNDKKQTGKLSDDLLDNVSGGTANLKLESDPSGVWIGRKCWKCGQCGYESYERSEWKPKGENNVKSEWKVWDGIKLGYTCPKCGAQKCEQWETRKPFEPTE